MATPAMRALAFLRQSLAPKGLDVVIPLTVERYNRFLERDNATAASDLTRFKLPIESALPSHLLVLIGNSKALWEPFLSHVANEMSSQEGEEQQRILPDPIDRYVKQTIDQVVADCDANGIVRPTKSYWVADTTPGKMILAQKMAAAANAVSRCPPSQICLHPVFGPWLAFRCALVFPLEGLSLQEQAQEQADHQGTEISPFCTHDAKLHELLKSQMDAALSQVSKDHQQRTIIKPDAWKKWVLPRITIAPNHKMMYDPNQILYHYTKDLAFLAKVVHARKHNLNSDYFRDLPPVAAVEFRELLQQVIGQNKIDAIALSGGLDTSILAEANAQPWHSEYGVGVFSQDKATLAKPLLSFTHAFTVQATRDAPDAGYARQIFKRLHGHSMEHLHILERSLEELLDHAEPVAKLLATCDPMELRNSVVIYAVLHHASQLGIQQIVTGDGADEIFCGYNFYRSMMSDESKLLAYRDQIMRVMGFTAPTLAKAFGIQVITPFLDHRVVAFAQKLKVRDLIGERTPVPVDAPGVQYGKLVMRQAFPEAFSQWRWKQPIEEGAGTTALRKGYFDTKFTQEEFANEQKSAWQTHGMYLRDHEHLFFFKALLKAFDGDLNNVPKRRRHTTRTSTAEEEQSSGGAAAGGGVYCPACGFELSHADQDFCVTCGFWPTCETKTNNTNGYATEALAKLENAKRQLSAEN